MSQTKRKEIAVLLCSGIMMAACFATIIQYAASIIPFTALSTNVLTVVYADAAGLMTKIFEIIAGLITAMGGIFGILGIVHYASANSEGDGPAKNKAMGQMAAGVMLIALSVVLKSQASTLTALIMN